jgi:hypothetical protein
MSTSLGTYSLQGVPYGECIGRIFVSVRNGVKAFLRSFVACWKLFAGGGVWEFMLTIDTIVTAEKDIAAAGLMSVVNTVGWGYFLYKILDAKSRRKEAILWMAAGCGLGCMLGTWLLK